MSALLIVGIVLVLVGIIILLLFPNRPGGEFDSPGIKVSSGGAGLPVIVIGVFCLIVSGNTIQFPSGTNVAVPLSSPSAIALAPTATPVATTLTVVPATAAPTVSLATATTSPVPAPSATPTKPILPNGTIVFASESSAGRSLYAVSPSGEDVRQLAFGDAHNPSCSPIDDSIAFESNRTGPRLIYTSHLSGSRPPVPVTIGTGSDQIATWNSDGKSLAFSRSRPNNTSIFTINLGDHREHQLTSGEGGDWRMSFAPSGGQIVFTSTRTGMNELWLMNADGSNVRQLTNGPGDKRDPAWSPDGKWIVFRSDRDGNHWDLYRVSPSDAHIVRLTSDSADKGFPNWSPDSRWILFTSNRGGIPEVFVMSVDGGDWIPITSPPTIGGGATWCRS